MFLRFCMRGALAVLLAVWPAAISMAAAEPPQPIAKPEETLVVASAPGTHGGRIAVAMRAEPKTLNPVMAVDAPSREVLGRMHADLLRINRVTQSVEASLAKSWKASPDHRTYTLHLRKGIRFSDGEPLDADDVVFTFQVYTDEEVHSPQRDLLLIAGKPIKVRKLDAHTVVFELPQPYAAADRIFDSVPILPRHLLAQDYAAKRLGQSWPMTADPKRVAGLGPFRLKEYVPGQRLVLERNPYYWKSDKAKKRLPYLDEIVFLFVPNEDAQVLRFRSGEIEMLSRVNAENFTALQREQGRFRLQDLGPSLEYNFLVFNLSSKLPAGADQLRRKQEWFRDVRFRQAVSAAIDRDGMNRLVYRGRGVSLASHVSPGYRHWMNRALPRPVRSLDRARALLREAGFKWTSNGTLIDRNNVPIEFTIAASSSNAQRQQMATVIQADLRELGIKVNVVPLEFRALLDRVMQSHDFESAVMGLGGGDADPNPQMNVLLSTGSSHLWAVGESGPQTEWEKEIDTLMNAQLTAMDPGKRKKMYDRVQQIMSDQAPFIFLLSPNVLVGANARLGNFNPAVLDHYTLWNAEELFLHRPTTAQRR